MVVVDVDASELFQKMEMLKDSFKLVLAANWQLWMTLRVVLSSQTTWHCELSSLRKVLFGFEISLSFRTCRKKGRSRLGRVAWKRRAREGAFLASRPTFRLRLPLFRLLRAGGRCGGERARGGRCG